MIALKLARLLLLALLITAVLDIGCVGFIRDAYKGLTASPTPSPVVMPTVTLTPINETVERQYMYAEMLMAGIGHYNEGIRAFNTSRQAADRSDWENATKGIVKAKTCMEEARADFLGMKPYAMTPEEIMLSVRWNDTAYYQVQAFDYVNFSYQEGAFQASRSFAEQNPVRYNYYVSQANYYISLALQSKSEAESLEGRTFIGQHGYVG